MTVTIVFKDEFGKKHEGQTFQVNAYTVHNTYNFLELSLTDGTTLQVNMNNVFSFLVKNN